MVLQTNSGRVPNRSNISLSCHVVLSMAFSRAASMVVGLISSTFSANQRLDRPMIKAQTRSQDCCSALSQDRTYPFLETVGKNPGVFHWVL